MPAPRKPGEPTTLYSSGAGSSRNSGDLEDRVKILLADDSLTMHRAVTLGLRNESYELIACDNGQDALRLALEHRPKIVLADLDMPGLTGIELLKKIREQKSLSETKVVLLCSTFDDVDESRINEASADGRLWKPFESHALLALIRTLITVPPKSKIEATAAVLRTTPQPNSGAGGRNSAGAQNREVTSPGIHPPKSNSPAKAPPQSQAVQPSAPPRRAPIIEPEEVPDLSLTSEIESVTQSGIHSSYSIGDALDEQGVPDETGPLQTEDIRQNLWSTDFESQQDSGVSVFSPNNDESLELPGDPTSALNADSDFEIVTSSFQLEADELPESINITMPEEETSDSLQIPSSPPLPTEGADEMFRPEGWSQDLDFSNFPGEGIVTRPPAPGPTASVAAQSAGPNEAQVRAWIREEIREAFDSWLKKNLEDQLSQVLDELDEPAT